MPSKYGFETTADRRRKELSENPGMAKAAEIASRIDPAVRDILGDLLSSMLYVESREVVKASEFVWKAGPRSYCPATGGRGCFEIEVTLFYSHDNSRAPYLGVYTHTVYEDERQRLGEVLYRETGVPVRMSWQLNCGAHSKSYDFAKWC